MHNEDDENEDDENEDDIDVERFGERDLMIKNAVDKAKQNAYSSTKSIAQEFLDVSIIVGHAQLLVSLFGQDAPWSGFSITLLVLSILALLVQLFLFVLVAILYKTTGEKCTGSITATSVNTFVTFLSGISLINNTVIAIIASRLKLS